MQRQQRTHADKTEIWIRHVQSQRGAVGPGFLQLEQWHTLQGNNIARLLLVLDAAVCGLHAGKQEHESSSRQITGSLPKERGSDLSSQRLVECFLACSVLWLLQHSIRNFLSALSCIKICHGTLDRITRWQGQSPRTQAASPVHHPVLSLAIAVAIEVGFAGDTARLRTLFPTARTIWHFHFGNHRETNPKKKRWRSGLNQRLQKRHRLSCTHRIFDKVRLGLAHFPPQKKSVFATHKKKDGHANRGTSCSFRSTHNRQLYREWSHGCSRASQSSQKAAAHVGSALCMPPSTEVRHYISSEWIPYTSSILSMSAGWAGPFEDLGGPLTRQEWNRQLQSELASFW